MTIEVSISNKDDHGTLRVDYIERSAYDGHSVREFNGGVLRPHETRTWHVHSLRDLKISEEKP